MSKRPQFYVTWQVDGQIIFEPRPTFDKALTRAGQLARRTGRDILVGQKGQILVRVSAG